MGIMLGNLSVKDIETRLGITLSAEDVAVLQEKRQENVSVPLASGKWHCFDIPFMFMAATRDDALMFADILGNIPGRCTASFRLDLNDKERRLGGFKL